MSSMDHSGHGTMDMGMTSTSGSMPESTSSMDMGGQSHGDDMADMMGGCKINMLWNWYTIDACFISESWRITTTAMFAGSCIGVFLLVVLLEFLRRLGKEYDRMIVRSNASRATTVTQTPSNGSQQDDSSKSPIAAVFGPASGGAIRPTFVQQAIRALLHTAQFAVAYFVMLLAMYYNGYIIICIFLGAYFGSFIFHWEALSGPADKDGQTRAGDNPTVCCG